MRKNRGTEKREWEQALRALLIGAAAGIAVMLLLLLFSAYAFVSMKQIPQLAVPAVAVLVSGLGALGGGFIAARVGKKRGLPLGAACGLLLFLLLAAAGAAMGSGFTPGGFLTRLLVMLLAGSVGGYAGIGRK